MCDDDRIDDLPWVLPAVAAVGFLVLFGAVRVRDRALINLRLAAIGHGAEGRTGPWRVKIRPWELDC